MYATYSIEISMYLYYRYFRNMEFTKSMDYKHRDGIECRQSRFKHHTDELERH